jgi:dipeptidyl aminopeptidase/acylaminoacyl peptidase
MGRITMPVLIHHGLNDSKAPPVQLDILRAGAGTDRLEFVTYDGGDHGLKDPQQRQRLLTETRDFLKKIR